MRVRLLLLRGLSLLLFVALLGRLYQLQFGVVAQSSRQTIEKTVSRRDYVLPQRGEIYASDGTTLLAASDPISIVGLQAEALPSALSQRAERNRVLMYLSAMLATTGHSPLTDTFTISPTTALLSNPQLAADLRQMTTILPADTSFEPYRAITITVPTSATMQALQFSTIYSDVVRLHPGAEDLLRQADLPPYLVVPIMSDVPRDVALALRENQASLPGVRVVDGFKRHYPLSGEIPSLSHLLGYVRDIGAEELTEYNPPDDIDSPPVYLPNDIIGKDGLELTYESVLRGTLGINQIAVDAFQRTVGAPTVLREVQQGQNLVLNIDTNIQRESEAVLRKWLQVADQRRIQLAATKPDPYAAYEPITHGVIMVMDVRTGAILASVSLPAYDNNVFTRPLTPQEAAILFQSDQRPLFNSAIAGRFPPGSTFKQFTAAAGLRYGAITPQTILLDQGFLSVKNKYDEAVTNDYPNSNRHAYGMINVSDALMVSSNVFFNMVAGGTEFVANLKPTDPQVENEVGIEHFHQMLTEEYGFGAPTGIDLPAENPGLIPDASWKIDVQRSIWSVGDTYNAAIGQGDVLVTPLQLLRGAAATATRGDVYTPQIVKARVSIDGTSVYTYTPTLEHHIELAPEYWDAILDGLHRSVHDAKAYNRVANATNTAAGDILGDIDRFNLAGKTGTAQYGPNNSRSHSWFVGFAPFDNPQYAVVALLEGTGDLGDGSATLALPAVVDIFRVLNQQPVPDTSGNYPVSQTTPANPPSGN